MFVTSRVHAKKEEMMTMTMTMTMMIHGSKARGLFHATNHFHQWLLPYSGWCSQSYDCEWPQHATPYLGTPASSNWKAQLDACMQFLNSTLEFQHVHRCFQSFGFNKQGVTLSFSKITGRGWLPPFEAPMSDIWRSPRGHVLWGSSQLVSG